MVRSKAVDCLQTNRKCVHTETWCPLQCPSTKSAPCLNCGVSTGLRGVLTDLHVSAQRVVSLGTVPMAPSVSQTLACSRRSHIRVQEKNSGRNNKTRGDQRGKGGENAPTPPTPHFPGVQLYSLPTYCCALLSERLEQASKTLKVSVGIHVSLLL